MENVKRKYFKYKSKYFNLKGGKNTSRSLGYKKDFLKSELDCLKRKESSISEEDRFRIIDLENEIKEIDLNIEKLNEVVAPKNDKEEIKAVRNLNPYANDFKMPKQPKQKTREQRELEEQLQIAEELLDWLDVNKAHGFSKEIINELRVGVKRKSLEELKIINPMLLEHKEKQIKLKEQEERLKIFQDISKSSTNEEREKREKIRNEQEEIRRKLAEERKRKEDEEKERKRIEDEERERKLAEERKRIEDEERERKLAEERKNV